MKAIWKFRIPIDGKFSLSMPLGAEIIAFQTQEDKPYIWAIVNQEARDVVRHFTIRGTGHPFESSGKYIGTIQILNGQLVWHLFELEQKLL